MQKGIDTVYVLTREIVDMIAEEQFNRDLNDKEIQYVADAMITGHEAFMDGLREIIIEGVEYYRLTGRNRNAETRPVFYRVYWKNESAFQKEYKEVFTAKTEKDARQYVSREFIDEFVRFRITRVDRGNETEIAVIKLEKWPALF